METIQIKVLTLRSAIEINSPKAGRDFIIDEIELGSGIHKKAIKYTTEFLKFGSECKAVIMDNGKLRIVSST